MNGAKQEACHFKIISFSLFFFFSKQLADPALLLLLSHKSQVSTLVHSDER